MMRQQCDLWHHPRESDLAHQQPPFKEDCQAGGSDAPEGHFSFSGEVGVASWSACLPGLAGREGGRLNISKCVVGSVCCGFG